MSIHKEKDVCETERARNRHVWERERMEDLHSILVNLLSNIVWLPLGVLLAYLGFWIQVRLPNRTLWQLKDPSHLVVCAASSTTTNTGVYHRPATGVGQLRALVLASRSLNRAYRSQLDIQNILLSSEPLQDRIEHDLLLLGGSQNREASNEAILQRGIEPDTYTCADRASSAYVLKLFGLALEEASKQRACALPICSCELAPPGEQ